MYLFSDQPAQPTSSDSTHREYKLYLHLRVRSSKSPEGRLNQFKKLLSTSAHTELGKPAEHQPYEPITSCYSSPRTLSHASAKNKPHCKRGAQICTQKNNDSILHEMMNKMRARNRSKIREHMRNRTKDEYVKTTKQIERD